MRDFFCLIFFGGLVSEFPSFRVSELPSFRVSEFPSYQVSEFPSFQRREGGRTNERPGTDHVISGPMRGLGKNCTRWRTQTDRQTDTRTWQLYDQLGPVGQSWWKLKTCQFKKLSPKVGNVGLLKKFGQLKKSKINFYAFFHFCKYYLSGKLRIKTTFIPYRLNGLYWS